ncbi:dioxygenase [Oleisolibacter albus]|uniref:dioxygenase family protein n=1 Tax=Oleisolibacter albus TaxID=2171757 RepID=UPI000DF3BA7F|nr:class III extradiol ring-cleavage dioxygenase [Oleisolibacter albus]
MTALPALFLSHGSPMLVVEDGPAHRFLGHLGAALPRPRAILAVSAHWSTAQPVLSAAAQPDTIHDFGGFPPLLYQMRYPAPGAPDLAVAVAQRLTAAGLPAALHADRGLDHGAWVPLTLIYPGADIPVLQLSIQRHRDPAHHLALGEALRPLRDEGVLILASGALTHNLGEITGRGAVAPAWVQSFADWMGTALLEGRRADLLAYRARAPHAARNHPTDEHLLPLFTALGAGTPGVPPRVLHRSTTYGVLAMDAFAFA